MALVCAFEATERRLGTEQTCLPDADGQRSPVNASSVGRHSRACHRRQSGVVPIPLCRSHEAHPEEIGAKVPILSSTPDIIGPRTTYLSHSCGVVRPFKVVQQKADPGEIGAKVPILIPTTWKRGSAACTTSLFCPARASVLFPSGESSPPSP